MDKRNIFLHKTNIMNYFSEHQICLCGSFPESRGIIRNTPIYYGIQYNHSGRFFLAVNHGEPVFGEGSYAFITHPNAFFEYGSVDGEPRHHNFICSRGARLENYIRSGLLPLDTEPVIIRIANPEKFLQTMLSIMELSRQPVLPPRAILLYEDLLLQMYESRQTAKRLPLFQEEFLKKLIKEIRKHPELEWDFVEEAKRCHVTLIHFRRLFQVIAGMPPLQFLIQCRLQHAANLLITTHESIASIAEMVGIEKSFYFSRLFKKKYDTSPLEYRRAFKGF